MTNKVLCIYHAGCADGFGAAMAVLERYGPENVELHPGEHGPDVTAPDCAGRVVYIVDYAYPADEMARVLEECQSLVFLDHHKSAKEKLSAWLNAEANNRKLSAVMDMTRSGAMIAWQHLHEEPQIPKLIHIIQDVDLWQFKYKETKAVIPALYTHPFEYAVWKEFFAYETASLLELERDGLPLLRAKELAVAKAVKNAGHLKILGRLIPAANAGGEIGSEVGEALAMNAPYGVVWRVSGDQVHMSLRSAPNGEDVSAVARNFRGGGHFHAAACSLSLKEFQEMLF